jgi:hypothetical protein
MDMSNCHVRNNLVGVAVEGGTSSISSSKIEANEAEGILLQGKGSATVVDNEVWGNGSTGILIGFDATRRIVVRGNHIHHNRGFGLFNGAPKNKKITLKGNEDSQNCGLPANQATTMKTLSPPMQAAMHKLLSVRKLDGAESGKASALDDAIRGLAEVQVASGGVQHTEWAKRVNKLGGGAACGEAHRTQPGCFGEKMEGLAEGAFETYIGAQLSATRKCWECGTLESPSLKLRTCQRCRLALYCSKDCQRTAWKDRHKGECKQHVEFPMFGNRSESVVQSADEKLMKRGESTVASAILEDEMISIQRGVDVGDYAALVAKAHLYLEVPYISIFHHMLSNLDFIVDYSLLTEGHTVHATSHACCLRTCDMSCFSRST